MESQRHLGPLKTSLGPRLAMVNPWSMETPGGASRPHVSPGVSPAISTIDKGSLNGSLGPTPPIPLGIRWAYEKGELAGTVALLPRGSRPYETPISMQHSNPYTRVTLVHTRVQTAHQTTSHWPPSAKNLRRDIALHPIIPQRAFSEDVEYNLPKFFASFPLGGYSDRYRRTLRRFQKLARDMVSGHQEPLSIEYWLLYEPLLFGRGSQRGLRCSAGRTYRIRKARNSRPSA